MTEQPEPRTSDTELDHQTAVIPFFSMKITSEDEDSGILQWFISKLDFQVQ